MTLEEMVEQICVSAIALDPDLKRGAPASQESLSSWEARTSRVLPASYRKILQISDGIEGVHPGMMLLGTSQESWVSEKIIRMANWSWPVDPNPFMQNAVPVLMGPDVRHFVVLFPDDTLVEYDMNVRGREFSDWEELLEDQLEHLLDFIDMA